MEHRTGMFCFVIFAGMTDGTVYMKRCLELAANGLGQVSPNPMVGAVLVCDGKIIGEGWHEAYGKPHAEVNAIENCKKNGSGELLSRSSLYVNLEPCNHFGKTPPCADLILENKIPEVFIGMRDPNTDVEGGGVLKLRKAGVRVEENLLRAECEELNRRFIIYQTRQRPYFILKYARSQDGFIAPLGSDGKIHWISNAYSRKLVHKWRTEEDAVMAGYHTVLKDNPQLTVRSWTGRNPVRVVVDDLLTLPPSSHVFNGESTTLLFNTVKDEQSGNVEYIKYNPAESLPAQVCKALKAKHIQSVILEGGMRLIQKFVNDGIWDEARILTAPHNLGQGIAAPVISGTLFAQDFIQDDELRIWRNPEGII
jgi:diaminohydroxyphosphoribosylaminopyrimidine deaminase/5-amino-6-(5-phosphoribosylamino)uracil reductase